MAADDNRIDWYSIDTSNSGDTWGIETYGEIARRQREVIVRERERVRQESLQQQVRERVERRLNTLEQSRIAASRITYTGPTLQHIPAGGAEAKKRNMPGDYTSTVCGQCFKRLRQLEYLPNMASILLGCEGCQLTWEVTQKMLWAVGWPPKMVVDQCRELAVEEGL